MEGRRPSGGRKDRLGGDSSPPASGSSIHDHRFFPLKQTLTLHSNPSTPESNHHNRALQALDIPSQNRSHWSKILLFGAPLPTPSFGLGRSLPTKPSSHCTKSQSRNHHADQVQSGSCLSSRCRFFHLAMSRNLLPLPNALQMIFPNAPSAEQESTTPAPTHHNTSP